MNKDGVKVAVLTFTKSAYRLGETIVGAVEINERSSRSRVLKVGELLPSDFSLLLTPFFLAFGYARVSRIPTFFSSRFIYSAKEIAQAPR